MPDEDEMQMGRKERSKSEDTEVRRNSQENKRLHEVRNDDSQERLLNVKEKGEQLSLEKKDSDSGSGNAKQDTEENDKQRNEELNQHEEQEKGKDSGQTHQSQGSGFGAFLVFLLFVCLIAGAIYYAVQKQKNANEVQKGADEPLLETEEFY